MNFLQRPNAPSEERKMLLVRLVWFITYRPSQTGRPCQVYIKSIDELIKNVALTQNEGYL